MSDIHAVYYIDAVAAMKGAILEVVGNSDDRMGEILDMLDYFLEALDHIKMPCLLCSAKVSGSNRLGAAVLAIDIMPTPSPDPFGRGFAICRRCHNRGNARDKVLKVLRATGVEITSAVHEAPKRVQ